MTTLPNFDFMPSVFNNNNNSTNRTQNSSSFFSSVPSYNPFNNAQEPSPDRGMFDDLSSEFSMSFTKRIICFSCLLGSGILLCFLSTWMLISPRTFAKFYTVGTLCILSSTFFLVSPKNQLKRLFDPSRFLSAMIYFGSMAATLYTALILQKTGLTILMVIIQFFSAIWYAASYVPFAQNCLRSSAGAILPV